jgi:uncharacterized protein with HEPN domain
MQLKKSRLHPKTDRVRISTRTKAVVRLIEILGEAAKNVASETQVIAPDIPWRQIAAIRDRLAHAYFDDNLDFICEIATPNLISLAHNPEQPLRHLEPPESDNEISLAPNP